MTTLFCAERLLWEASTRLCCYIVCFVARWHRLNNRWVYRFEGIAVDRNGDRPPDSTGNEAESPWTMEMVEEDRGAAAVARLKEGYPEVRRAVWDRGRR